MTEERSKLLISLHGNKLHREGTGIQIEFTKIVSQCGGK